MIKIILYNARILQTIMHTQLLLSSIVLCKHGIQTSLIENSLFKGGLQDEKGSKHA